MLLLTETMSAGGFFSAMWKFFIGFLGFALEHPFLVGIFILLCIGIGGVKFYGDHSRDCVP